MRYSITFFLDKRNGKKTSIPVLLQVAYDGNKMRFYTGKRCDLDEWDPNAKRLARLGKLKRTEQGDTTASFNAELTRISSAVDQLFEGYTEYPTEAKLRYDLKMKLGKLDKVDEEPVEEEDKPLAFFDYFDKFVKDSNFSPGREKHMYTTKNKILAFNRHTTFEDVNFQYLTDFKKFLLTKWDLHKKDREPGLSNNTVVSEFKRFRSFWNSAMKAGWVKEDPFKFFEVGSESYGRPVYISLAERDFIRDADIPIPHLDRVRDMFVMQCYLGCRVGDFTQLTRDSIIDDCIEYIAGKTKDNLPLVASIPLTEAAKKILAKYDFPDGKIMPFISDNKYNLYIKELFAYLKINRKVTIPDKKSRKSIQVPISEIASTHMARRVFIGGLIKKGVKDSFIASMSGHVKESKAFTRYYDIDREDQRAAIKKIE